MTDVFTLTVQSGVTAVLSNYPVSPTNGVVWSATDWIAMSAVTENGSTTAHAGDLITITMGGMGPMTVSGQPSLLLSNQETATYAAGSGTDALTFIYMVKPGDDTADLQITGIDLSDGASIHERTITTPQSSIGGPITSLATHDLGIHIDTTMTSPTSVQQEVMGLYAALYGRAGEASGLSYWVGLDGQQSDAGGVTVANAGITPITLGDAAVLGQGFVTSQSTFFNATYGNLNDSQFINALYTNIGGTAGDPNGVAYWSNLLANAEAQGQSVQGARAELVGQFVDALIAFDTNARPAGLTDQQWSDALTRTAAINNKIAVSTAYANASTQSGGDILIPHAVNDPAYHAAITVLQGVTADPNTVAVAIAGIDNAVAHHDLSLI